MTKEETVGTILSLLEEWYSDPELPVACMKNAVAIYEQMPTTMSEAGEELWRFSDLVRCAGHDVFRAA